MNLFVGNINPVTTAAGLRQLFSEFGEVVSSKIIMDPATGQPRGFGFVEMADKFHSFDAIDNLDATFFEGNVISVKEAKQNNMKGGSGGGRKPFNNNRPRTFNQGSGGGYNRDNNRDGGGGGYNRDNNRDNNYNRDGSGGGYNRDNNRDSNSGGYNRDNNNREGGYRPRTTTPYPRPNPRYDQPVNRPNPNPNTNTSPNTNNNDDDDRFNRL